MKQQAIEVWYLPSVLSVRKSVSASAFVWREVLAASNWGQVRICRAFPARGTREALGQAS